jgi:hypothetical protein
VHLDDLHHTLGPFLFLLYSCLNKPSRVNRYSTLIIAPAGFSEVPVLLTEPTRRHMSQDTNLQIHKILKAFKPCWNSAKWSFYIVQYFEERYLPGFSEIGLIGTEYR